MAQHRGRRSFRLKQNARVIGTRLADEFTELRGLLRRKAICIIDHNIGTGGVIDKRKVLDISIVSCHDKEQWKAPRTRTCEGD